MLEAGRSLGSLAVQGDDSEESMPWDQRGRVQLPLVVASVTYCSGRILRYTDTSNGWRIRRAHV